MVNLYLKNNLVVETAYKNLQDPEKKKIIQRIIREAKERVENCRREENKKRNKKVFYKIFFLIFYFYFKVYLHF